jgi:hypothetical protein
MPAKATKSPTKPRKPKAPSALLDLSAVASTERDLADLRKRAPDLASSGLAAAALEMSRGLDSDTSFAQKSLCAKELKDIQARLVELAPKVKTKTRMDDLAARRAKRLAG